MYRLRHELHLHLYGCLGTSDILELGEPRKADAKDRLEWYSGEFERAFGRRPDPFSYWSGNDGAKRLAEDFEFRQPDSFSKFQAKFNLVIALFPFVPGDVLVLRHVLGRDAKSRLRYAEYRVFLHPETDGNGVRHHLDVAADACLEAQTSEFTPRLVLTMPRARTANDRLYAEVKKWQSRAGERGRALVGLDYCGAEDGHPPKLMADFCQRVQKDNHDDPATALAILYHVGESYDHMAPQSAVRWVEEASRMGAHRLGHAIALGIAPRAVAGLTGGEPVHERRDHLHWLAAMAGDLEGHGFHVDVDAVKKELDGLSSGPADALVPFSIGDEYLSEWEHLQDAVMSMLRERGTPLESCPTSNFRIGRIPDPSAHPLPRFLENGIPCTVSTDDPGIFGVTLADEEELCRELFGLNGQDLERLDGTARKHRAAVLSGREETH